MPFIKVIIDKSRGEVSLFEQDTIENVSQPIKNQKKKQDFFLTSFYTLFSVDATMFLKKNSNIFFAPESMKKTPS